MSRAPLNPQQSSKSSTTSGSSVRPGTITPIDIPLRSSSSASAAHASAPTDGEASSAAAYFQPINHNQRSQRHNVHVLFLADQRGDHFLNRVTAMIGKRVHKQGFCHTEIVIPDMETTTLSCPSYLSSSIYNGETVTLTKTKTFSNPGI